MFLSVIFFCLTLFLYSGCTDFSNNVSEYEITVVFPEIPAHLKNISTDIRFLVEYPGLEEKSVSRESFAPESKIIITTSLKVLPIVAYAIDTDRQSYLYPAGGIYPSSYKDGELNLTWEDGFAAQVLYKAVINNIDLSFFNVGRFKKTLLEKSEGNPWVLDENEILYNLAFEVFNANSIGEKPKTDISFSLPLAVCKDSLECKWVLSNPLDMRVFKEEEGQVTIPQLVNRNVSVSCLSSKLRGEIYFSENQWNIWFTAIGVVLP